MFLSQLVSEPLVESIREQFSRRLSPTRSLCPSCKAPLSRLAAGGRPPLDVKGCSPCRLIFFGPNEELRLMRTKGVAKTMRERTPEEIRDDAEREKNYFLDEDDEDVFMMKLYLAAVATLVALGWMSGYSPLELFLRLMDVFV